MFLAKLSRYIQRRSLSHLIRRVESTLGRYKSVDIPNSQFPQSYKQTVRFWNFTLQYLKLCYRQCAGSKDLEQDLKGIFYETVKGLQYDSSWAEIKYETEDNI